MKRVAVSIKSAKHPEVPILAYSLIPELGAKQVGFFSTQKFAVDEKLELTTQVRGETIVYEVIMFTTNERISSGRVMNALPTEEKPFSACTFYKCYAKVLSRNVVRITEDQETTPHLQVAPEMAAPEAVTPVEPDATLQAA